MKKLKIHSDKQYQYAEAKPRDTGALRCFGWMVKRGPLHEDTRGNKVAMIRRFVEFSKDPEIAKNEKVFFQNSGKGQRILKNRYIASQIFAVLFAIAGLLLGIPYLINAGTNSSIGILARFTATIDTGIDSGLGVVSKALNLPYLVIAARVVFIVVGVIALVSVFINKMVYAKRKNALPERLRRYDYIASECAHKASQRVVFLKAENAELQTRQDRKLFNLEMTAKRAFDRYGEDDYI